jgi:hypothetical protein
MSLKTVQKIEGLVEGVIEGAFINTRPKEILLMVIFPSHDLG